MYVGSDLNTVSSWCGQQKGNNRKAPASAEKTFYTAETPKVYQIFTTDNMLWTGGNGTGLSYCLKYEDDSTDENPVVLAKGVDENGKEFEQRIYINDVDPSNATVVEMRALEAHYKVEKQGGFTSLPLEAGNMLSLIHIYMTLRLRMKHMRQIRFREPALKTIRKWLIFRPVIQPMPTIRQILIL